MFARNVGIHLQVHTALQLIRPTSTNTALREPQISTIRKDNININLMEIGCLMGGRSNWLGIAGCGISGLDTSCVLAKLIGWADLV
jgi:hypothetical protein